MTKRKWGESFLKSGLPLEHLTLAKLRTMGFHCNSHIEYPRANDENKETWFELDLVASHPEQNKDTELSFLIECKYHDMSRFWFFLPHEGSRWHFDDRVLNPGPFQTLNKPRASTLLNLAPTSSWGIVVSEDGSKQDNAVYTAVQQLSNGFVSITMSRMFGYNIDFNNVRDGYEFKPLVTALIPMIVTNATLYRLKPDISDLDLIREAKSPTAIADKIDWTWCYFDPSTSQWMKNYDVLANHIKKEAEIIYRYPLAKQRMLEFCDRPNWILIVNIRSMEVAITAIIDHFKKIRTTRVADILSGR